MAKEKKKFYKRWWFWLLIIMAVVGSSLGDDGEKTVKDKDNSDVVVAKTEAVEKEAEEVDNTLEEVIDDIDFEKVIYETKEELMNPEFFSHVKDIHIDVNKEENKITFTAVLADSTAEDVAVDFADTIIRRFSGNVQMQNSSIKGPGHEYLGEVFDYYNIMIGVAPLSKTDNSNEWYVFDAISKGRHRNPKAK